MKHTKISICNLALSAIGAESIVSFDDETEEAAQAKLHYEMSVHSLLASFSWGFATRKMVAAKLQQSPEVDWAYAYVYPHDCFNLINIRPKSGRRCDTVKYEIVGDEIHSDVDGIVLEYITSVEEKKMPPYFVDYLVADMAVRMNEAIGRTANMSRLSEMLDVKMRLARNSDSVQKPPIKMPSSGILSRRNG